MTNSFYRPSGAGFEASELTRGPWHEDFQHGGPPSALTVRALEAHLASTGWTHGRLVRLTAELMRPVPIAGLHEVRCETVKAGGSACRLAAELSVGGKVVIRATALAIREAASKAPLTPPGPAIPSVDEAPPFELPFFRWASGYHTAMELRLARGTFGETPTVVWMRQRVPLLPDETPSPFCRAAAAADSGNGVSPVIHWRDHGFANPDLTVALFRQPEGEWIALEARTDIAEGAIGAAHTHLHDARGPFGYGIQTLLVTDV